MNKELPNKLTPFLWHFMRKYKYTFWFYVFTLFCLSETMYFFVSPYILKIFIDGLTQHTLTLKGGLLLILVFGFTDLWFPMQILARYLNFNSISKSIEDIRVKLFTHSLKQSTSFFNNNHSGSLSSRINVILNKLNYTIQILLYVSRNFFLLFTLIFVFFAINTVTGIIMLFWFFTFLSMMVYWTGRISSKAELAQEIQDEINGLITDDFVNIKNIKIFSSAARERQRLSNIIKKKIKIIFEMNKNIARLNFMMFGLNYTVLVTILIISVKMMLGKEILLGTFFFILELCRKITMYSQYFGDEANEAFKNISIMKEGLAVITNDIEIKDKKEAVKLLVNNGKIVFKNINFGYRNGN